MFDKTNATQIRITKIVAKQLIFFNSWILQVAPAELEDLIRTMEGVQDVAVIGIHHEKYVKLSPILADLKEI